jgi:hypothetical protein
MGYGPEGHEGHEEVACRSVSGAQSANGGTIGWGGQSKGARRQRDYSDRVTGHVEELDGVAFLAAARHRMAGAPRPCRRRRHGGRSRGHHGSSSRRRIFRRPRLPRVHGNESRHVGASVNLPDGAKLDAAAVRRNDRSHNLVHDAVCVLMRAGDVEREVLIAQIRPSRRRVRLRDAGRDFP